jgi:hypothetical protein
MRWISVQVVDGKILAVREGTGFGKMIRCLTSRSIEQLLEAYTFLLCDYSNAVALRRLGNGAMRIEVEVNAWVIRKTSFYFSSHVVVEVQL